MTDNEKIVAFLEKSTRHFENDSYADFEKNFLEFESFYQAERSVWAAYIYDFLDCWSDAWNHDWNYHDPLEKNDWAIIAKKLIVLLRENRDFEPIDFKGQKLVRF